MINENELMYKIDTVIEYLKTHDGNNYKLYNRLCPNYDNEPDSNIIEYAEDVKMMIQTLIDKENCLDIENDIF